MTGAMSLTNEFGVQAAYGINVRIGSTGNAASSSGWSTLIAQGVTGQLTLQVLPGSMNLWNGSAPMAVAGRGWSVAAADASATEGTDATIDFEVRLNARDDCKAVKVDYATADGTATAGEDYAAASGTLTFQPGESVKTIRIPVLADAGSERGETFALRLSNALGVAIADTEAIGTIRDDDVPTLSRASVDDAVLTLSFSEALDGDSVPPASSFAVTVAGSPRTVDAVAIAGSAVTLTLSSAVSSGESVTVGYTVPTGAGARPVRDTTGNAAVAFSNNSVTNETAVLPVVSVAASATPVTEGTAAAFSLSRTGATDAALTVSVSVSETGAAVSGTMPASVTFEAGSASVTLSVPTEDDEVTEDASTVTTTVSPGTGYIVDSGSASADVIVEDNDAAPVVMTASPILVPENSAAVATLAATDEDTAAENLSWSIPEGADGGADAAKFALTTAGVLTFKAAKDYESPDDANTDGDYEVTVRVTDGANPVDAALVVRLTDVDEVAPTLSSVSVDGAWMILVFNEGLDQGSHPSVASFAVTVAGSSRGVVSVRVYGRTVLLELSSAVVSGEAVTLGYTVPTGEHAMPVMDVAGNVAAAFSSTEVTNETAALPVVSTASPIVVPENATAVATLTATDADTAAEDLTWSIPEGEAGGDDAAKFALTTAGVLTFKTAKDFEAPDDADNDGDYEVTVRVTDGANPVDAALVVRLSDVAETEPLTASLAKMPETHDGSSAFQFEVHFSEEPRGLSYRTVRDGLFDVTNGRVTKAKRLTRGSNLAFVVTFEPTAQADIDIAVLGTASCGAVHAVCADGKTLAAGPSVTVLDARTITLTVADAAVDEGPGATLDFVASLSRAASGDITVSYNTTNEGTATEGVDYEAVDSSFVFSAGQTEKTISVAVLDDALDEVSETVNLAITATVVNGVAVSVADNIAIGTIRDVEDVTPTMSRASVDGADLTLTFSEALDGDSVPPGSAFAVTVADAARSVDAVAISESALTLTLSSAVSSGETVAVRYTVPTGAGAKPLKDAAGNMVTGFSKTSVRNETAVLPVVSIAASATPVAEGTAAAFTLSRTGATTAALEVTVSVAESEAAVSGTPPTQVTFEAGSASATLSVATEDDEAVEGASTVTATVSSGTGYTVAAESGSAEVVVNDEDAAPVVTTATPIEVPENATAVATLAATDADTAAEDLTWSIPEGADGGADAAKFALTEGGELTFRTAKDFEAPDDANADGNYEVTVRVTDGANPVDAALVVRLTDVDEIELSVADAEVEEGPGATLDFVVSLSHAADDDITVYYRVHDADGTATAGADYEPVRSSFVFSPGETQRTVSVVVLDDTLNEGAETVNFWISGVRGLTIQQIVDPYATGTILESDQDSEPVTLSVADAEVDEGPGATLDFVVSLSRAADDDITVYYRVHDGTATAGADYEAVRSSFVLSPGQTEKTVSVVVLDDALDEGAETVNFWISGVRGLTAQQVVDPYATGTIRNTDKMPTAWIARFGRTVADHVFASVEARWEAAPTPGMEASLAGQRIGGSTLPENVAERQEMVGGRSLSDWLNVQTEPHGQGFGSRIITERDLLTGSSFALTAQTKGSGLISTWGRGAVTRFDGRQGDLTVDGEVTSGMLGADWTEGAWKTGLVLTHSLGEGGYQGASAGTVTSTLTGIFPWARHTLSEWLSVWSVAGYGEGSLVLEPEEQPKIRTDLDLWTAAAGLRGVLLDGGDDGPTLAAKTDVMIVQTSSDAVSGGIGNLAAAEAEVTRLRFGLEGGLPVRLANGSVLTPGFEIGMRHDGGDAETGFGADFGAGLAWADPRRGLAAELRGRGLLTHEAKGFRIHGLSGSLSWDPVAGERGPRLSLTQTVGGSSSGGAEALFGHGTLEGLAANHNGSGKDNLKSRLELKLGYGFAVFGDLFTWMPEAGVGLSDTGRDYSLGWRLLHGGAGAPDGGAFGLSFEARRHVNNNDETRPEHEVGLWLNARF